MAGFVAVAVIMRPLGGWLSDRVGPIPVLAGGYVVVVVCAGIAATHPVLEHAGTAAFLIMAMALGSGTGATFALIARVTDPARVGGVTPPVAAAGGLGGFVPPLIMGYVYGRTDSYAIGLWMLSATAALTALFTVTVTRRTERRMRRPFGLWWRNEDALALTMIQREAGVQVLRASPCPGDPGARSAISD